MDNQVNPVPTVPQPSQKKSRPIWLWIILGFACLCSCAIIPIVAVVRDPTWLNLLKTGAPQVKISAGTYNGTIYTAPESKFSCDFKDIMVSGLNPLLQASENVEKGTGTVFAWNDFGQQYGVDYFNTALWGGDTLVKSLSDPETRQQSLQAILKNILLPARSPKAEVTHQEFLPNDLLFVVLNDPEASNLVQESNGVTARLNNQEGYYIFAGKEWFYFAYYYQTPRSESQLLSPPDMQSKVDGFYRGCQFQP